MSSRLTPCGSRSRDTMFVGGVRDKRVGGDAASILLPRGFIDAAPFGCAIEHLDRDTNLRAAGES